MAPNGGWQLEVRYYLSLSVAKIILRISYTVLEISLFPHDSNSHSPNNQPQTSKYSQPPSLVGYPRQQSIIQSTRICIIYGNFSEFYDFYSKCIRSWIKSLIMHRFKEFFLCSVPYIQGCQHTCLYTPGNLCTMLHLCCCTVVMK